MSKKFASVNKNKTIGIAILAAGRGVRLKLKCTKPLAPICGVKLIDYPVNTAISLLKSLEKQNARGNIGVVIGHQKDDIKRYLLDQFGETLSFAVQETPLGTADALKAYFYECSWAKDMEQTLVMCSDTPLLKYWGLHRLWERMEKEDLQAVAATFIEKNPTGYGRIIRKMRSANSGFHIVEEKEANDEQKKITEVNSGLYLVNTSFLLSFLDNVNSNNNAKEFYLTDLFQDDAKVKPILFENKNEFLGVNTLEQLELAENLLCREKIQSLREMGVRFIDSQSCYIESEVLIGSGTVVYPNCHLQGKTKVGENCVLGPGSILLNSHLHDNVVIKAYSYLENAEVQVCATVGPFARLRKGTVLGKGVKIGNFVETKESKIGTQSSVSHLSYVGDAEIGENTNIGCGFITCNYDGSEKHKTKIGSHTFIGSDTQIIAPRSIGNSAYVASGSTIHRDIPDRAFAIARSRQSIRKDMAQRFLKGKWALKGKKRAERN